MKTKDSPGGPPFPQGGKGTRIKEAESRSFNEGVSNHLNTSKKWAEEGRGASTALGYWEGCRDFGDTGSGRQKIGKARSKDMTRDTLSGGSAVRRKEILSKHTPVKIQ